MGISRLVSLLALVILSGCSTADTASPMAGQKAPDFSLPDQNGNIWKLSEAVRGQRGAVLAFYPKDDTRL